jgi:BirA family biotin operon repressor/biotin-[acetyl-CoA-carboxylase] ligase
MPWRVEHLEETSSTNDVARDRALAAWARGQPAEGIAVAADRQTGGRGQHGRAWERPPGGLYLSAVVERVPADLRDKLALIAGVAAAAALDAAGVAGAMLRWPNDLVLGGRKAGGILCEAAALGDRWAGIVGVGINVNTAPADFSAALRPRATSLSAHDGRTRVVNGLLAALLAALAAELGSLATDGLPAVVRRARARDPLRGRVITVDAGGRVARGLAAGLADDGTLRVQTRCGMATLARGTLLEVDGHPVR